MGRGCSKTMRKDVWAEVGVRQGEKMYGYDRTKTRRKDVWI